MTAPLTRMLARKTSLVLDGAMGTELQRRGVDTGLPLWSANALMVHPDVVLQIHREYIEAGADVITTDTFRTTRRTFRRAGIPDRSEQLTRHAVDHAMRARALFPGREILIAGSIAPLEDCYRPDLVPPDAELAGEHAELAGRLASAGVDFLLLETMGTIRESVAACKAASATGLETVVSFICDGNGNLYGGERLEDAVRAVAPFGPVALSINCVSPRRIAPAITTLRTAWSRPFAVYANIGVPENEKAGWEFTADVSEEEYAAFAQEWRHSGASIIGGCCGTTPEYIRTLAKALRSKP